MTIFYMAMLCIFIIGAVFEFYIGVQDYRDGAHKWATNDFAMSALFIICAMLQYLIFLRW